MAGDRIDYGLLFLKDLWNRLNQHDVFTYAASLSYYALLSFIPLTFIAVAAAGEIIGRNTDTTARVIEWSKEIFPFLTGRLEENIHAIVDNRGVFGGIGIFSLWWAAHMALAEGEKIIRRIFGVRKKRALIFSHAIAWGIFLVSVVGLAISFLFGLYLRLMTDNILPKGLSRTLDPLLNSLLLGITTILIVALSVSFAYKLLPQRVVSWKMALMGGFSFAVLWEMAKKIFFIYVGKAKYVALIYGSLGALMLFLFFVYYSALLFVVIAEVLASLLDTSEKI